jgi:hypothetical protein
VAKKITPRAFEDDPMFEVPQVEKPEPRKTRLKEGWKPLPAQMAKVRADFPEQNIDEQLEAFRDWHGARGSKFVDWYLAFRTWLRNDRIFREKARRAGPERRLPNGQPFTRPTQYNPAEELQP